MKEQIPIAGPWITDLEVDYVSDAAKNGWYENASLYQTMFEKTFASYVGRKHALALPSCTSALHLSIASLNIGVGDEVLVPDVTWIATAAPICYAGATPVFVDIDPDTWCISVDSIERNISDKTKAIIVVDLYGNMPEMDAILTLAEHNNIHVIEDAAEAIGSEYKGNKAGSFGTFSTFSFHGTKTLTTGEGGMLLTDNKRLYDRCCVLCDHGRDPDDRELFYNKEVAYKYKMSSMQAAMGLGQIERIEDLIYKKREIFNWYSEELASIQSVTINVEPKGTLNTYWMVTALINPSFGIEKGEVIQQMADSNIACRPFFNPLSTIPAFSHTEQARKAREGNVVALELSPYGVNLPSAMNITRDDVIYVCNCLKKIMA